MNKEEALVLLDKYLQGECSVEEYALINQAYNILIPKNGSEPSLSEYENSKELILKRLQAKNAAIRPVQVKLWPKLALSAAIVIAVLGFGLYFFNKESSKSEIAKPIQAAKVLPGRNGATITLANGKTVALSDLQNGVIIGKENMVYADGSAIEKGSLKLSQVGSLTASTARGQTYAFTLPDGTKVWLNADSKITFAQPFVKKTRQVFLEGEAYFEVSKNKNVPFVVNSEAQKIEVLGTHFNVSTYKDDEVKLTTLLEGSIAINSTLLKPNEQASQKHGNISIQAVDASMSIDWIKGKFTCKNEPLVGIMKSIARWYDVDVVFENDQLKQKTFSGSISRYENIASLLEGLKYAGINSKLEGRQIKIIK